MVSMERAALREAISDSRAEGSKIIPQLEKEFSRILPQLERFVKIVNLRCVVHQDTPGTMIARGAGKREREAVGEEFLGLEKAHCWGKIIPVRIT